MNNPYSDLYSEFHSATGWLPGCQRSLSEMEVGRSDWETITTRYPMLTLPTGAIDDPAAAGPNTLPLAVTQVTYQQPITPAQTLDAPIFSLVQNDGGAVVTGNSVHAYLFAADGQRLIDLGRPRLDQVQAYGARPGDRLCVYEPAAARQGCMVIQVGVDQLRLQPTADLTPAVLLSPVTSTTLQISVTTDIDGLLQASLYPANAAPAVTISLAKGSEGYTGEFHLAAPVLEGYLKVWVDGQAKEIVTDYALGGNPAPWASRGVPWVSRGVLLATPNAPSLQGATISFQYLGNDVPAGEESFLRIYYREAKDATRCPSVSQSLPCWRPLATTLDTFYNFAAAPLEGPGLYALMSSIELPLTGAGWNLFAYPVQGVRPVAEALQSIKSAYSVVWGYDSADPAPWHFYAPAAPAWANDLANLQFGKGYWLYVTVPGQITLYLQGQAGVTAAQNSSAFGLPAVYYGTVSSGATLTAVAGMPVTAWVENHRCGATQTQAIDGQIVYVIKVAAEDSAAHTGCGADGRTVTLQVEGTAYQEHVAWHNAVVKLVDFPSTDDGVLQLFLSLIANN